MKNSHSIQFTLFVLLLLIGWASNAQMSEPQLQDLVGSWKIDMSPENPNDNNYASMVITEITSSTIEGEFYRETVKIREGRVNVQTGIVYAALVSGDNSGDYNTSFYYQDGKLYGSTHSLYKDFLAVWVATKIK